MSEDPDRAAMAASEPSVQNLADLLVRAADPASVAVRVPGRPAMTYGELDQRSAAMAGELIAAGVRPGDRVACQVDKSADAVALHLACLRAGAVQLPVNPSATDDEVAYLLADSEPAVVVHDPSRAVTASGPWRALSLGPDGSGELAAAAARRAGNSFENVPRGDDDAAALLYTSGTTGLPKGALLSQGNLAHNAMVLVAVWGFDAADTVLHVLPLHHTHGLFVALHCALVSGATTLLMERFDAAQAVELLPSSTVLMGVPTHYVRLLAQPGFDATATDRLRLMTSGSAPLSEATHRRVRERTGHAVLERYGMTETSILTSNPLDGERRPGTVGRALPGVEVRVVAGPDASDDGEREVAAGEVGAVQVRGPNVFQGYWRRPELRLTEFTADGWFRTGDLGSLAPDGYLTIVGRSKDLVITGGLNVYPKEVEAVLDQLPGVAESAVVGVPDPDLGESVVAVVVPVVGVTLDPGRLRALCRERMAGYKVPKQFVSVSELPRNTMGKVEKSRLRADLGEP